MEYSHRIRNLHPLGSLAQEPVDRGLVFMRRNDPRVHLGQPEGSRIFRLIQRADGAPNDKRRACVLWGDHGVHEPARARGHINGGIVSLVREIERQGDVAVKQRARRFAERVTFLGTLAEDSCDKCDGADSCRACDFNEPR